MQGFLLLLAMLTAQANGADLSQVQVSNAEGQVVVQYQNDACDNDTCFVYTDRVGDHIMTEVYNGASYGTNFGMGRSVRHMARLLGDYTGNYHHRVGRTNGRVVIEEWQASYTGGNCSHTCHVVIYRTWHGGRWHWASEVG